MKFLDNIQNMSRSYKKNPYCTDSTRKVTRRKKRVANHSFRNKIKNNEELPSLNHHKKLTESWIICDYKNRMTREEAIEWYNSFGIHKKHGRFKSLDSWLTYWEKCYRRK